MFSRDILFLDFKKFQEFLKDVTSLAYKPWFLDLLRQ